MHPSPVNAGGEFDVYWKKCIVKGTCSTPTTPRRRRAPSTPRRRRAASTPRRRRAPSTPPPTPPPYDGPIFWTKGGVGKNCMAVCGSDDSCIEGAWPTSEEAFKGILEKLGDNSCSSYDEGDWQVNPAVYVEYENACYWRSARPGEQRCSDSHYATQRFCPCKTEVEKGPAPTPTPVPTTTPRPSRRRCGTRRRCPGARRRRKVKDASGARRRRRNPGRRRKAA